MTRTYPVLILIAIIAASAGFSRGTQPVPSPSMPMPVASPIPSVAPYPSPEPSNALLKPKLFVSLGKLGVSVDPKLAQKTIDLMNEAERSGCLKRKALAHKGFTSFNTVFEKSPKTAAQAYAEYVAGAPYTLDLHWYSKRFSSVIGYTYNFKNDDWNGGSETRIWSNTRMMGDARMYAAHLAHELSHQARAGGYVHYSVHQGSMPYEIGDIMQSCAGGV